MNENIVALVPTKSTKEDPVKIEKNVFLYAKGLGIPSKYIKITKMEINDSIFIAGPKTAKQWADAAYKYGTRHDKKFVSRNEKNGNAVGRRIWRTQ